MESRATLKILFAAAALALTFLIPLSLAQGQSGRKSSGVAGYPKSHSAFRKQGPRLPGRSARKNGKIPSDAELVSLMNKDFPITVVPGGVGFDSLQDALDYCGLQSGKGGKGRTTSRDMTVILQAGTNLNGNWVLPTNGIKIVGVGGPFAVSLSGKPGVNAPVLTYAPNTGSIRSYAWIRGLWIFAREEAAVEFNSNNSYSDLWLEKCQMETEKNFPGIRVTGSGYDGSHIMRIEAEFCGIESQGTGVSCSIGPYVESLFYNSPIWAKSTCFEASATAQGENEFIFFQCPIHGEGPGIKADNIQHLWLGYSIVGTDGTALDAADVADIGLAHGDFTAFNADTLVFSNCPYARIQYSELSSEATGGRCIKLLNGSEGRLSFLSLYSDKSAGKTNAVYKDGTSTWTAVYNQWREEPWP